jgi:uncharacterized protein (TIGR02246 family)
MEDRIRRLLDESDIRELLLEFARAIDAADWTAYAETFAEDGVFEIYDQHRTGRDEIAAGPRRDLTRWDRTQHYVTNLAVTVDGDVATARGEMLAVHIPDKSEPTKHADAGGIYHCRLRRTDEGWRFSTVRVEILWFAGLPMPRDLPLEPSA